MNRSWVLLAAAVASTALAQSTEAAAPPASTEASTAAPADGAAPTTDERLTTVEGQVSAAEEKAAEQFSALDALKKIKLSGYLQPRWGMTDGAATHGFSIRRGRLKATYSGDWAQYVLQIDATPAGVSLKDAEATLIEPWTGRKLSLTMGQTKWPFGFEVQQSSGDREFPERTRVIRAFAAGERDRGVKLNAKLGFLRANAGVFDGNGTETEVAGKRLAGDNDKSKDVVGRVGVDFKWISGGVSGWWGETYRQPVAATDSAPAVEGGHFPRNRLGVDVQLYLDLLGDVGGTQLRGEWMAGRTYWRSNVEQFGRPATGWYAVLVQNLGLSTQVALRYDYFDGLAGTADSVSSGRPASTNGVGTFGVAVIQHLNEHLELTAAYELPVTGTAGDASVEDPRDNVLTVQLQVKF